MEKKEKGGGLKRPFLKGWTLKGKPPSTKNGGTQEKGRNSIGKGKNQSPNPSKRTSPIILYPSLASFLRGQYFPVWSWERICKFPSFMEDPSNLSTK